MTVADIIRTAIDNSIKKQKQIAREAGFANANVISMLKTGATRVPIARVPSLAKSLSMDPGELMRACLSEYQPDYLDALGQAFNLNITTDETKIVNALRKAAGNGPIVALSDRSNEQLNTLLTTLRAESLSAFAH